ncbi:MAG: DUF4032 domain-containing protein [Chloroflexi bacterium]|nr:DUF4032 domain-containing protein [Chloroflexota bacterium]
MSDHKADFNRALFKAFLRDITSELLRQPNELFSFEEVRKGLRAYSQSYRGLQSVPLDKIVGSVSRYRDFDRAFLPTQLHTQERWVRIDSAMDRDEALPPVELYKVGDVYFVRDGNHRVSVAREHGAQFIDAEVTEFYTSVPFDEKVTPQQLLIKSEYAEFLERTKLDKLRPDQSIEFTTIGRYQALEEHIAVHRYFLGQHQGRHIPEDEAVMSWYDTVYMPIIRLIREQNVLSQFPGRTEADLYLWIMDHRYYLSETYGADVGAEEAIRDYAEKFGQHSLWSAVARELADFFEDLRKQAQEGARENGILPQPKPTSIAKKSRSKSEQDEQ